MKKLIFIFILGIFMMGLVSANLNDRILTYYKFDEGSGTTVGSSKNPTKHQLETEGIDAGNWVTGILGTGLRFNGIDEVATNQSEVQLGLGGNWSFQVWINHADISNNAQGAMFNWINGTDDGFSAAKDGIAQTKVFQENPISTGNVGVDANKKDVWYHIISTYNGTTLALYWQGGLNATVDIAGPFKDPAGTINMTIGRHGYITTTASRWYNGTVDEVAIWNKTLNASDVSQLYNSGLGLNINVGDVIVTLDNPADESLDSEPYIIFNTTIDSGDDDNNLTSATLFVWNKNNNTIHTQSNVSISNQLNSTTFNITLNKDIFLWNVLGCAKNVTGGDICDYTGNRTLTTGLSNVTQGFSNTYYETDLGVFNVTFNSSAIPTGNFYFNGTKYVGTATNVAGDQWRLQVTPQVPLLVGIKNFFWEIFAGNLAHNTTITNKAVNEANFSVCGPSPLNVQYLNFTYQNETVPKELTTAFVSESTFNYWLGDGSVNKTLTFSNATEATTHTFCFSPQNRTVNVETSLSFDNSESQQRVYNPGVLSLSNSTSEQVLWLLPTNDGIFVTFQVLDVAGSPISNALLTLSRTGFGDISVTTTGGSGTSNIWLNPNFEYKLVVTRTGFSDFEVTQAFPTTEFTIVMGTTSTSTVVDRQKGIVFTVEPKSQVLKNETDYAFNFTINSTFHQLQEYGFTISNQTTVLASNSSTSSVTGGTIHYTLNTANNTFLSLDYFWVINSTYVNGSVSYGVHKSGDGSISSFFDRLKTYTNEGIFGITPFGFSVIIFMVIFLTVGIMAFKFGLTSPTAVAIIAAFIVILFDTGFGMLDLPGLPRFIPSILAFMIAIAVIVGDRL